MAANVGLIREALKSDDEEAVAALLDDEETVFWVDS